MPSLRIARPRCLASSYTASGELLAASRIRPNDQVDETYVDQSTAPETFKVGNKVYMARAAKTFTNTNTFASISATRDNPNDPRELQFSLKYYF